MADGGALAGWWPRVAAMAIDVAILAAPTAVLAGLVNVIPSSEVAAGVLLLLVVVIGAGYFGALTGRGRGQTIGARAVGIAVRDVQVDAPIGLARGLLRWFVRFTLYFFVIPGLLNDLWPLWDRRRQSLADRAADSVVVTVRPSSRVCPACAMTNPPGALACLRCAFPLVAPPGWYPDPQGLPRWRFWTGAAWGLTSDGSDVTAGHSHDVAGAAAPAGDVGAAARTLAPARSPRGVPTALLSLAIGVVLAYAAAAWMRRAIGAGDLAVLVVTQLCLWGSMLAAVFLTSRTNGTGSVVRDFGWRFTRADVGAGTVGALVARSTTVIVAVPLYAAFHTLIRQPQVGLTAHRLTLPVFVFFAVTACIGAPIVEELFFRGLVQGRLVQQWGPWRGIAATSLIFGAAHLIGWRGPATVLSVVAIAASGAVLGYLRNRSRRLGPSIVAHGLFNSLAILVLGLSLAG